MATFSRRRSQMKSSRILVLLTLIAARGFAQDRGTISGVVTDPTGAASPDATVTVKSPATGFHQATRTGNDGTYTIPYLAVGLYTLTVENPGFRTVHAAQF